MMRERILLLIALLGCAALPCLALASRATSIPYWPSADQPLISCTGNLNPSQPDVNGQPMSTKQSCVSLCDLVYTMINIIYFGMTLALEVIAPILFIWGGFLILTAGAKPDQISKAKKLMIGTVVGILIILCSFLIMRTVASLLGVGIPGLNIAFTCPNT